MSQAALAAADCIVMSWNSHGGSMASDYEKKRFQLGMEELVVLRDLIVAKPVAKIVKSEHTREGYLGL